MPDPLPLLDACRDLAFGTRCCGCSRPGTVLCSACGAGLPRRGRLSWPTPVPAGMAPPFAGGDYDALLQVLVNRHKEHAVLALARPLGRVLGDVVVDLLRHVGEEGRPVRLEPVPSRSSVVRRRGHDPLLRVSRQAAARLRTRGVPATVGRRLVGAAAVRDQSQLSATERADNLVGSMRVRRTTGGGRSDQVLTVVVDDVLTTGATAREAQRALEDAGVVVSGIATVAATRRRWPTAGGGSGG